MTIPRLTAAAEPELAALDGRQSAAALEIQRGVGRLLGTYGLASVVEMPLANGRRADVVGLSAKGDVWIVEIKSSVEDFRADHKWPEYIDFSDRLYFAVASDFPLQLVPETTGLILADRYGGEFVRHPVEMRLAAARRKAMTLAFARLAAARLSRTLDPKLADLI
jgi:hypothetical protein